MITFLLFSKFAGDDILIIIGLIAIAFCGLFIECSIINVIVKIYYCHRKYMFDKIGKFILKYFIGKDELK